MKIGAALDASVTLYAQGELFDSLKIVEEELRFILITSEAQVKAHDDATQEAISSDLPNLSLTVKPNADDKCVRCWHRRPEVGTIDNHPELCGRCVENIESDGENRMHA